MRALRRLLLLFALMPMTQLSAQGAQARWDGSLALPTGSLPIVLHLVQVDGTWTGSMDSPAQGAVGIPLTSASVSGEGEVSVAVGSIGMTWVGRLEGDRLVGTFSQGGFEIALEFDRAEEPPRIPAPVSRPQTPEGPFPYEVRELRFPAIDGSFELAGTLTIPSGPGPHPAVILVSGSGAQDRDEALAGHQPFWVLADHLSRHGIAVLRYDDRGVGESGGSMATATTVDLSGDAEAALNALRDQSEIDRNATGIIGHSEGGLIAPMVANRNDGVAYIVMIGGPAISGRLALKDQSTRIVGLTGGPELAAFNGEIQEVMFEAAVGVENPSVRRSEVAGALRAFLADADPASKAMLGLPADPTAFINAQANVIAAPWMHWFLQFDPTQTLQAVEVPALALFGGLDLQIHPDAHAEPMRAAFAGNASAVVEVLPGLNHLMQSATTGSPAEYERIEETMSPIALERMSGWIRGVTGRDPGR